MPQRLGVFGGTFDPPHRGHLAVAAAARSQLGLDRVLLVVANDPWKKSPDREITPAKDRLAMVHALARGDDGQPIAGLEVSDAEIRRGGPSYTITTLRELGESHPGAELYLIIGRDLVDDFGSWHESSAIETLATIVVVDRPGYITDVKRGWKLLIVPPVDVSSTQLRERLRNGDDVSEHLTSRVVDEIRTRRLYGVGVTA
ncbi:MAG: nicotinate-nucleotide adenylyltransferase [Ilumatobacteraceae bacterium]